MHLALSSWCWHAAYYAGTFSLHDVPAAAARLGVSAVELNDFMLPPPRLSRLRQPLLGIMGAPEALWRYSGSVFNSLATLLEQHGTTCAAWSIDTDLLVPPHRWPAQHYYVRRGVRAAEQLGAQVIRLTPGGEPYQHGGDQLLIDRLVSIARHTNRWYPGLQISVENHWGISTEVARFVAVISVVREQLPTDVRNQFGVCFDPGNVPADVRDRDWALLAQHANHVHMKTRSFDSQGNEENFPYPQLLQLLKSRMYSGWVSIEYEGDQEPAEGIAKSRALFERMIH